MVTPQVFTKGRESMKCGPWDELMLLMKLDLGACRFSGLFGVLAVTGCVGHLVALASRGLLPCPFRLGQEDRLPDQYIEDHPPLPIETVHVP